MSDKLRGHEIYNDGSCWRYVDTNEETVSSWKNRDCGHCRMANRLDEHDACLGELPGVMNACCGHGVASQAYIQLADGTIKQGDDALRCFEELRNE